MTKLSINLNKVALLRNQRDVGYPSVLKAAHLVISAGANGVTVHPRPDGRHVVFKDVIDLEAALRDFPGVELNVEGYPSERFLELVDRVCPSQVTLVPDAVDQRTSDHGWDLKVHAEHLRPIIASLQRREIRVAVFVEPDLNQIEMAKACGSDRVELYTGPYARAERSSAPSVLAGYVNAAQSAVRIGLGVNAGHDLTLQNLPSFLSATKVVDEVSIGHGFVSDALELGYAGAVKAYREAMQ